MSTYNEAMKEAVATAKQKVNLVDYATAKLGMEVRGKYVTCPFCHKKGKMIIGENSARCFSSGCAGSKTMDHIGLYMEIKGTDYRAASTALLEYAGVEHPWDKFQREKEQRGGKDGRS